MATFTRAARQLVRPGMRRYGQVLLTQEQSALAPMAPETAVLLKEAEGPWGAMSADNKVARTSQTIFIDSPQNSLPTQPRLFLSLTVVGRSTRPPTKSSNQRDIQMSQSTS
jgi:hypothetical protein